MENNNIEFREIRRSDYTALEKIISETWNYERFCSPKTARQMSRLYLANCLASQTFTCVAQNNGETVGIIMGKNERTHRTPLRYNIRRFLSTVAILLSNEGRKISEMFAGINKLDEQLLHKNGQNFDGELAFFAVQANQRGTGIGKSLFSKLLDYMNSQGIEKFYLYTDSTCNFGFYEHQGMTRLQEEKYSLKPNVDVEMLFFLYGYGLNREDSMAELI